MKKIWQKSLASMVSAALCLTAFVGCLTVSAEKGSATITVENVSAKQGAEVVVPVKIKANTNHAVEAIDGVAVALFDLKFDTANLTVTKVSAPDNVAYCAEPRYANGETGEIYVDQNTSSIRILATFKDTTGKDYPLDFDLMTVNVTFKISADAKAGEYPVEILKAQACDAGTKTGTLGNYQYADDEDFIALTTVNGNVTVTPATTAPVLDENITCTLGTGLSDTVYMSFKISKASLNGYSDFYLKVDRQVKDSTWNFVDAEPFYINKSDLGGNYLLETTNDYWFYYRGVELYSLSVPISAVLYCKDTNGNVVAHSNTFSSSLSTLLQNLYANAKSKNRATLATAVTDILITGDKAVTYFTRNATDSDYAKLPSPIENFDTSDATPELGSLVAINTAFDGTGDATLSLSAGISTSPYISAILSNIPSGSDISSYSVTFSYTNALTSQLASSTTVGADMLPNKSGTNFYSYLRTLPIYASNADVTITVFKDGSLLGTAHYSLEQFISVKKDDATLGEVTTALGKMGQSFRAYKGI